MLAPGVSLYSITSRQSTACQGCTRVLCICVPRVQELRSRSGNFVKYLIELGLHHPISLNQATVNQSFALPVVSQLSIHFDLKDFGLWSSHILYDDILWVQRKNETKQSEEKVMRKGQAREIGTTYRWYQFMFLKAGKTP